jgi:hypothetical protein
MKIRSKLLMIQNWTKNIVGIATAHSRIVYAAPAVAGLASVRLGRYAPTPHSTHILPALKMLCIFLFGLSKRRMQPEC